MHGTWQHEKEKYFKQKNDPQKISTNEKIGMSWTELQNEHALKFVWKKTCQLSSTVT